MLSFYILIDSLMETKIDVGTSKLHLRVSSSSTLQSALLILQQLVKLERRLDELKGNQLTGTNLFTVLWIRDLHEFLELPTNSG